LENLLFNINTGNTWLTECLGLFFGSLIQEDIAVVSGGLLIIRNNIPFMLVFLSLFIGIIVGDVLIYGLGASARKIVRIRKWLVNPKIEYAKQRLENNLTVTIFFVRFLPGILFPTYLACGLMGISFTHFFVTSIITGALYTSLVLTLIIKLGEFVIPQFGMYGWIILLSIAAIIVIYKNIKPRKLKLTNNMEIETDNFIAEENIEINRDIPGMPSLKSLKRKVSASERIPQLVFYAPVGMQWLLLALRYRSLTLPTIANPHIEAGGLWGESKSRLMNLVSDEYQKYISPFTAIFISENDTEDSFVNNVLNKVESHNLGMPFVIKPDIGWQGYGVRVIKDIDALKEYFQIFPKNSKIILQKLIPFKNEAGIFFMRKPGEGKGKIISLTFRYLPFVVGNGRSTVKELIEIDERTSYKSKFYFGKDNLHQGLSNEMLNRIPDEGEIVQLAFIGSLRVGGLYKDGRDYITDELDKKFNEIACSIPEFYFGRFDIKFKDVESLQKAQNFQIFEINGAGAEAIHIWDANMTIPKTFKELFKYQSMLFKISNQNRKRGYKPMSLKEFYQFTKQYNQLISSYPSSQ
jgi:membrane protein DedA with SNARE-associated domain